MPSGWRIVRAQYAATAFSGEGARLWRGRWHSRGAPVVYLAEHRSLCVLEVYARARPISPRDEYVLIGAEWDESFVAPVPKARLPDDWAMFPYPLSTAAIGDKWVRDGRAAVLAVPSAIIPAERNYVINPTHPDFRRIKIGKPEPFVFDSRLVERQ